MLQIGTENAENKTNLEVLREQWPKLWWAQAQLLTLLRTYDLISQKISINIKNRITSQQQQHGLIPLATTRGRTQHELKKLTYFDVFQVCPTVTARHGPAPGSTWSKFLQARWSDTDRISLPLRTSTSKVFLTITLPPLWHFIAKTFYTNVTCTPTFVFVVSTKSATFPSNTVFESLSALTASDLRTLNTWVTSSRRRRCWFSIDVTADLCWS